MPGSVPLDSAAVLSELTQYLPDSWKPIIDTDIDGAGSIPVQIDTDRPAFGQRATTRRLARTIFIGAAPTLRSAHKGCERPRVWLGVAIPGDVVGNFGSALDLLAQRATYLYADGQRYWFDTQASVQRTATDMADRLRDHPDEVYLEIKRRLLATEGRNRGGFAAVHIAPDSNADIPDLDEARLVILHPSLPHTKSATDTPALAFVAQALEKRGSAQRANRNMLVFLAPDAKRLDELMEATREFLAWDDIAGRVDELNLAPQQARQAATRRQDADATVQSRIAQTYVHALVPEQPDPTRPYSWAVEKADGAETQLPVRVSEKLSRAGLLANVAAPRGIRMELDKSLANAWASGHISVGQLWGLYSAYPYLPRLKNRAVLAAAVAEVITQIAWESEGFALADRYDEANGRYDGLVLPGGLASFGQIVDTTLLVKVDVAKAQIDPPVDVDHASSVETVTASAASSSAGSAAAHVVAAPRNTRYFGVYKLDSERYGRDLTRLSQEILQHLASMDGANMEVTVEVHATKPEGFPDDKARVILENARTLHFEQSRFED